MEIFVEADFETRAEQRRRFAIISIPATFSAKLRRERHDASARRTLDDATVCLMASPTAEFFLHPRRSELRVSHAGRGDPRDPPSSLEHLVAERGWFPEWRQPMNSQQPSGVNSSASESARPIQSGSDEGARAKAGEAVSRLADAAQQAGAQAKEAASVLASDASQKAKALRISRSHPEPTWPVTPPTFSAPPRTTSSVARRNLPIWCAARLTGWRILPRHPRAVGRRIDAHGLRFHPPAAGAGLRLGLARRLRAPARPQEQSAKQPRDHLAASASAEPTSREHRHSA